MYKERERGGWGKEREGESGGASSLFKLAAGSSATRGCVGGQRPIQAELIVYGRLNGREKGDSSEGVGEGCVVCPERLIRRRPFNMPEPEPRQGPLCATKDIKLAG